MKRGYRGYGLKKPLKQDLYIDIDIVKTYSLSLFDTLLLESSSGVL